METTCSSVSGVVELMVSDFTLPFTVIDQISPGCGVPERVAVALVAAVTVADSATRGVMNADGLASVPPVSPIEMLVRSVPTTVAVNNGSASILDANAAANSASVSRPAVSP